VVTTKDLLPGDIISLSFKKRTNVKRAAATAQLVTGTAAVGTTSSGGAGGSVEGGVTATGAPAEGALAGAFCYCICAFSCLVGYVGSWCVECPFPATVVTIQLPVAIVVLYLLPDLDVTVLWFLSCRGPCDCK
jgi:hypothetical protein